MIAFPLVTSREVRTTANRILPGLLALASIAAFGGACSNEAHVGGTPPAATVDLGPQPPLPTTGAQSGSQRLTYAQYANAIHDLFGDDVVVPPSSSIEPDLRQTGFFSVGSSFATVSPRGVEQYEKAAFDVATQVLGNEARKAKALGCVPSGPADDACARQMAQSLGRRAWRRPLTADEVTTIAGLTTKAGTVLGDFLQGASFGIAAILQSPSFLFRPAAGEADPSTGKTRYTSYEMASRLSFFLWNAPPDAELLDAADAGLLVTDAGLAAQTKRLLASPRAHEGLRAFVTDWLGLADLDALSKDPTIYTYFTPDLGKMAREETLRVFERQVFDLDDDIRDVFTTTHTFVNPKLASMYQVPAPDPVGFGEVDLPPEQRRRGILGHTSFLSLYAHPTTTSSTLRGRFVRTTLLCATIPPPPVNVNTSLTDADADAPTLRDRMKVHMSDPTCASCHRRMDPIGLGFERFDSVGRFRTLDHGAVIDPSGDLDGVAFSDAWELAGVIREHPALPSCIAKNLYRYATSFQEGEADQGTLDALTWELRKSGHKMSSLITALIMSPAFRLAAK